MRIKAEVHALDIYNKLRFHGETRADKEVVEFLGELNEFLGGIAEGMTILHKRTVDRPEYSAKEINKTLASMRKNLLWELATEDDVETLKSIINELDCEDCND